MANKKKDPAEEIVSKAREEFDVLAVLQDRPMRTRSIRLFTDEPLGEKIGGREYVADVNEFGLPVKKLRTWGIIGEIADLNVEYAKNPTDAVKRKIAALKKQVKTLSDELQSTAFEMELHDVPGIVQDVAERFARKVVGIKGRLPEEGDPLYDEYNRERDAQLLTHMVTSLKNNATGQTNIGISVENARALKELLPRSEWLKVIIAMIELLQERAIAQQGIEDLDFSQGI